MNRNRRGLLGLKFFLLGPPKVTWNDATLCIPRHQVRLLLYYLASSPNPIPQDRLHYLLWSDKSEEDCRRNFSHLLTHIRLTLPEKDMLIVKDSLVALDHHRVWCDVLEFKDLIHVIQNEIRLDAYKRAAEFYRGSYMEGVKLARGAEFENVIEMERFGLERNYLNLLYKLILIEKQNGSYEPAIEYAYRYLSIDNLSEEVHRQLILLYGLTGNREHAITQYRMCEDILQRELQISPSKKTQLAYQYALSDPHLEEKTLLSGDPVKIRIIRDEPGFVSTGSLNEFTKLLEGSTSSGIALLHGELGIGKSSLFTRVLSGIGRDRLILRTRCDPAVRSLSFWPLKNLLKRECKAHPSVGMQFPGLFEAGSTPTDTRLDSASDDNPDFHAREKFFTLYINCFLALAEEKHGFILCIEDMEWADPETLDLFLHLCKYTGDKNLLLLASFCCPNNNNLREFLYNIQLIDGFLGSVKVQGVSVDEAASMARYWIGHAHAERALIERLHQLSGGNPFFISELLRWIMESGKTLDVIKEDSVAKFPATIAKAIDFRLSRLGMVERRILETAAVVGYSFGFDQVGELSDIPMMQILDALDELVNRHFLFVHGSKYQFAHELLRQSILDEMSPARRQFLEKGISGLSN